MEPNAATLPDELMIDVLHVIAEGFPIGEVFALRRVNTMFADELLKGIVRNGRLEAEGFYSRAEGCKESQKGAWGRCPVKLQVEYLGLKLQNHQNQPTAFTTYMTEVLELDEVKNASPAEQEVTRQKLLYGASAAPVLEYTRFVERYNETHSASHGSGQSFVPKMSYEVLLSASAVRRGDEDEFARVFENDGDIPQECGRFFIVPLYPLAMYGTTAMVRAVVRRSVLFRNNAKLGVSVLLHLSLTQGNKEAVTVWLPILRAKYGVHSVAEIEGALIGPYGFQNAEMVQFLLERCMPTERCLHYKAFGTACEYGHPDILDWIVRFPGFNRDDAQSHSGANPLWLAKDIENKEARKQIIKILIRRGFDMEVLVRRLEGRRAVLVYPDEFDDDEEDEDDDDNDDVENDEESDSDSEWEELQAVLRRDVDVSMEQDECLTVKMSQLRF